MTRITRGASRTKSSREIRSTAARKLDSSTGCMTITSAALTQALLHHRLDRNTLEPEQLGHLREDPGPVGHLQMQVERELGVRDHREVHGGGGSDGGGIAETTSPSTALAVWMPPAPGPERVISVIAATRSLRH